MTLNPRIGTLLIATRNPAKVARYREILAQYAGQVIGLPDVAIHRKPEEHGETAEENAQIKARFYASQANQTAFAEDEALYVDFLPHEQQPGVHVRRINQVDEASDEQLLAHWEQVIAQVVPGERTGKWHVAFCIAQPHGSPVTFAIDLPIRFFSPSSPNRIPGWPMSSLEGPLEWNKPHSELTAEELRLLHEKIDQAIAKALREMPVWL